MRIKTKIKKWGNSLALRLSGPMSTVPHFQADMVVYVDVTEEGIEVHPAKHQRAGLPFKEGDLLKGLTAKKAHADETITLIDKEIVD